MTNVFGGSRQRNAACTARRPVEPFKRTDEARASYGAATKARPSWAQPYVDKPGLVAAGKPDQAVRSAEAGSEQLEAQGRSPVSAFPIHECGSIDRCDWRPLSPCWNSPADDVAANQLPMLLVTNATIPRVWNERSDCSEILPDSDLMLISSDTTAGYCSSKGSFVDAVAALERATALAPAFRSFRFHLGMAQLQLANSVTLAGTWSGTAGDGQSTWAKEAREALSKL